MNILRGGKIDRLAQKDAKTLCFAPSGLNSKRRYLFGANTFHDVIGYLCTHRQLPVKLAYSRFRDESKPATSLKSRLNYHMFVKFIQRMFQSGNFEYYSIIKLFLHEFTVLKPSIQIYSPILSRARNRPKILLY